MFRTAKVLFFAHPKVDVTIRKPLFAISYKYCKISNNRPKRNIPYSFDYKALLIDNFGKILEKMKNKSIKNFAEKLKIQNLYKTKFSSIAKSYQNCKKNSSLVPMSVIFNFKLLNERSL